MPPAVAHENRENWRTRLLRWRFNLIPAFWGTGAKLTFLASDFREAEIRLPLSWRTRNYVGTIFGGSMYAAVDPIYMVLLIHILGPDYVVWDKAATIRFRKPGRSTLHARFTVPSEDTDNIRKVLETTKSIERTYTIDLQDAQGVTCASVEKLIYIRKK